MINNIIKHIINVNIIIDNKLVSFALSLAVVFTKFVGLDANIRVFILLNIDIYLLCMFIIFLLFDDYHWFVKFFFVLSFHLKSH